MGGSRGVEPRRECCHRAPPRRLACNPKFCEPDTSRVYSSPKSGHLLRRTCLSNFRTDIYRSLPNCHTPSSIILKRAAHECVALLIGAGIVPLSHNFHPSRGDIVPDVACVAKVEPRLRVQLSFPIYRTGASGVNAYKAKTLAHFHIGIGRHQGQTLAYLKRQREATRHLKGPSSVSTVIQTQIQGNTVHFSLSRTIFKIF